MTTSVPETIRLDDPALDETTIPPPAFACGECDETRAAARLLEFAAVQLRHRVADLEHALALALELLDKVQPLAIFADDVPTGADTFGLLDPPIVAEVVADPFAVAVAGESSGGAFESCVTSVGGEVEACGDLVFDGSGHRCSLPPGHGGVHSLIEGGRPVLHWGRSRV